MMESEIIKITYVAMLCIMRRRIFASVSTKYRFLDSNILILGGVLA
jgi:hypothetical protein